MDRPELGKGRSVILHLPQPPKTSEASIPTTMVQVVEQARSDEHLVELWLHGRSKHTQRSYRKDANHFLEHLQKPLHQITLGDLQAYADVLAGADLAVASQHRRLSAVKSLFAFGHRLGYLLFDTARPLRLPAMKNKLAERILDEAEVLRMVALERQPRNHTMLLLLYAAGLRVSEICGLKWSDVQARGDGGQIAVFGKGSKTRHVLLPKSVWHPLTALRDEQPDQAPVFRSRKKGHLTPPQVWRIVRRAAKRASISKEVSTHWLRHAHASHALNRGAAISLVQATLGHSNVSSTSKYLHARPDDSSSNYLPL
jgi:integrase/recombinase XerD